MTEIKNIESIAVPNSLQGKTVKPDKSENFETLLKDAVNKVNAIQNEAEKAIQELSSG
jgi:flagellar hook-basal body complex protein FliE